MSHQSYAAPSATGFISSLEGLRAIAALGVLTTHVAFQTGVDPAGTVGSILARFDFFVAVFFALSAFLLWRRRGHQPAGRYYLKRAARILPAYWVTVVSVLLFIPTGPWLANLTLTQIYVVGGLMTGLTHLWSLCVEVAFYLVLPLVVVALDRFGRRARVGWIVGASALSLGWAYLPVVETSLDQGLPNLQICRRPMCAGLRWACSPPSSRACGFRACPPWSVGPELDDGLDRRPGMVRPAGPHAPHTG